MIEGQRTIRRLSSRPEIYAIFSKELRVGTVSERTGNPPGTDPWDWQIGFHGLPGQHWIEGTAPDRKTAEERWKAAWPGFSAKRTAEDWQLGLKYVELSRR